MKIHASNTQRYLINCPYCGKAFTINLQKLDGSFLLLKQDDEKRILPYARDVGIFDPSINQVNSPWSKVGEDFLGSIKYDRLFGILRLDQDLKIYYCVARCPTCGAGTKGQSSDDGKRGLIDIFINQSKKEKQLSEIWTQLFSHESPTETAISLFRPKNILSTLLGNPLYASIFLLLIYFASFLPDYIALLHKPSFSFGLYFAQNYSDLFLRGLIIFSLFLLILIRVKLLKLFTDKRVFSNLFQIKDPNGLVYWMNWAESRFTGYQREGKLFTFNSVIIFGGFLSSLIYISGWALYSFVILRANTSQTIYTISFDLTFWLIVSFLFGVLTWNYFEIPNYILPSLNRIPMNTRIVPEFKVNFKHILSIGIYSGLGIFVLYLSFVSLVILPFLITGFLVPQWIIFWAEFSLIVFNLLIIVRFAGKNRTIKLILMTGVIIIFILLKYWLPSLSLVRYLHIRYFAEIILTLFLGIYFIYKLFGITCLRIYNKYLNERKWKYTYDGEKYRREGKYDKEIDAHRARQIFENEAKLEVIPLKFLKIIFIVITTLIGLAVSIKTLLK